ncbi:GerMN domain-containing protein [Streptomyces sp. NPDC087866]|uniref:GerMN domain-containing protein n=1 Tax=unclassified Streptomyces TaxID=2593676 RepID=UPI0011CDAA8E|nr:MULTISPECIES: GerMN domain-containing protein [unclassified Streptomyces]MCX4447238.1 GerMN domain-containing protein [Streptomyces sp. NBC_01789]TXS05871.1 hypothetical protein EAO73_07190 [Streptomyces sp. col6]
MRRSERRGHRTAAALAGAALCAVLATGCGIRTTSVPVDAGAAPSRVPCAMPAEDVASQAEQGIPVQVYLVCASQLVTVDRAVQVQEAKSDRLRIATALLDELRKQPTAGEREAGFSTDVPKKLRVSGPRAGDTKDALRLSEQPEDLPAEALAQIVCTLTESESLTTGDTVTLGGPGNYPARGYLCTTETKASPKAVPSSIGVP